MSELTKVIRPLVVAIRAAGGDATHHEDAINSGVPDVSYGLGGVNGWVECKYLKAWPKRESTVVRLLYFTDVQRAWLAQRSRTGGSCWVLLRVDGELLLFSGHKGAPYLGMLARATLTKIAEESCSIKTRGWHAIIDTIQRSNVSKFCPARKKYLDGVAA